MICSVTYYLELHNAIIFIVHLIFYQQSLTWLFENYRSIESLLVGKLHQ